MRCFGRIETGSLSGAAFPSVSAVGRRGERGLDHPQRKPHLRPTQGRKPCGPRSAGSFAIHRGRQRKKRAASPRADRTSL
nr:MAG TPA: hypothetical protein [Caudoviricetes sp.]